MLYNQMKIEKDKLTAQIIDLQKEISRLPDGKLVCSNTGKYTKWYNSNGHDKVYIPKKSRKLAVDLAYKKYLAVKLDSLVSEIHAIDFYLRHHKDSVSAVSSLLRTPCYQQLLSDCFRPNSTELSEWANASYNRSTSHPEKLTHRCASGNIVRSKSEMLIDTFLYTHKIPFRYESPLSLDGITLYPDFTLRHPVTGSFYYWEHFGLADEEDYLNAAFKKLRLYASHGILPTINLITTFETKEFPLNTEFVESLIHQYLS